MSPEIPVKTSHDWKDPSPGYLEIDFMVHSGGSIMHRLIEKHPERHDRSQLRTLQRRIGEWRATMARSLLLAGAASGEGIAPVAATKEQTPGEPAESRTSKTLVRNGEPVTAESR